MRRLCDGARMRGELTEQKCTRTRAGPDSWGEASAWEGKGSGGVLAGQKTSTGVNLGQQRAPGCLRRARNADAAVSCLRWVRGVVEVWGGGMGRRAGGDWPCGHASAGANARAAKCWAIEGRGIAHRSPEEMRAVAEAASSIRICIFLVPSFCRMRGLRTDACASGLGAWMCWMRLSALDSALCGDCGRRWKFPGSCCPEDCCWDQELQASGGGSRSFDGFAKILGLPGLQGLRSSGAPAAG